MDLKEFQKLVLSLLLDNSEYYLQFKGNQCSIELRDESKLTVPTKKIVCTDCEGCGTELMPGLKGHAFTESEVDQMGSDFYDMMDSMREGIYDVQCSACKGQNVVSVPNLENLSIIQLYMIAGYYMEIDDIRYADEMEARGERMMGA